MNRALLTITNVTRSGFQQRTSKQPTQAFGQQGQLMAGANTLGADQQRMATLLPQLQGSRYFKHWVQAGR